MRILGVVGIVLAVLGLAFGAFLLIGNPELNSPGPHLFPGSVYGAWRFLLGVVLWGAAVWLTVGLLGLTRQPGLAWLMLLAFVLLFVLYLGLGALMTNVATAFGLVAVLGVVVPVVLWLIARVIGTAVRRRRPAAAV